MPNLEWSMSTDPTQPENVPTLIGTGSTFSVRIHRMMGAPVPDTFIMLATVSLDFDPEWTATIIGFMDPEEFWLVVDTACAFHPLAWSQFATGRPTYELSIFPSRVTVEWTSGENAGIIYVGKGPTVHG